MITAIFLMVFFCFALQASSSKAFTEVVLASLVAFMAVFLASYYLELFYVIAVSLISESILAVAVIKSGWKYSKPYFWLIATSIISTFLYGCMMISGLYIVDYLMNMYFILSGFLTLGQVLIIAGDIGGHEDKNRTGIPDGDFRPFSF